MKVETDFDKCIVCMKNPPGDWEHIIPKCLGGMLQAQILCTKCNNDLGSSLVAPLCSEQKIQDSIRILAKRIPNVYKDTFKKQPLVGKGTDGSIVKVINDESDPKVLGGKGVDGSTIRDTREAEGALRKKLQRAGFDSNEISEYQEAFRQLAEEEDLPLPNGEIFVKHLMPDLQRAISTTIADDRIYVLIAFEFLSLCVNMDIFSPYFNPLRKYIAGGPATEVASTRTFMLRDHVDTYHILRIYRESRDLIIESRLFGWLVQQTRFRYIDYPGPEISYMEDIESRRIAFSPSTDDFRAGCWYSFT